MKDISVTTLNIKIPTEDQTSQKIKHKHLYSASKRTLIYILILRVEKIYDAVL